MIDVMIAKILFIYKQRFGAEQTYEEAVRYYKMSANDGNSDALDSLKALLDKIQYSEYGKESNMNVIYLGSTLQNTEKEKTSAAINAAPELEPIAIDIPKEGNCGMNTHWVLDDSGVLTISGTGKIEPIRGRAELKHDPWRYIKKIVIERGVTEIGNQVFQRCRNLQDVTLPEGLLLIGKRAFACCYDIKSINIPNTVKAIEDGAFFQCKGLTHVTFPKSLELIGSEAFMNCHGLTSVSVPEEISIPKGRNIFFGCRNINLLERFDPMDDAQKSMVHKWMI